MRATAKDLRYKTKEILAAIDRGEEVLITYRGKEKARIVPVSKEGIIKDKKKDALFGIWEDNEIVDDVHGYLERLREGRFGKR
jgi:prevent-host-death family protein